MYLIDSSVWVALFLNFDSLHAEAEKIFFELDGKIYLPYGVAAETATVLTYKHSKKQADNFLNFITNNDDILLADNQIFPEIDFYKKVSDKISFIDASLLFLSKKLNLTLITFDKQLIRILRRK